MTIRERRRAIGRAMNIAFEAFLEDPEKGTVKALIWQQRLQGRVGAVTTWMKGFAEILLLAVIFKIAVLRTDNLLLHGMDYAMIGLIAVYIAPPILGVAILLFSFSKDKRRTIIAAPVFLLTLIVWTIWLVQSIAGAAVAMVAAGVS